MFFLGVTPHFPRRYPGADCFVEVLNVYKKQTFNFFFQYSHSPTIWSNSVLPFDIINFVSVCCVLDYSVTSCYLAGNSDSHAVLNSTIPMRVLSNTFYPYA